jgi:hypothetical protein
MKEKITNPVIAVRRMYKQETVERNTANWIFTSNYSDAMPLSEDDRRYFVVASHIQLVTLRLEDPTYFKKLFTAIANHTGAITRYLVDKPLHPDFVITEHAPMTAAKEVVIGRNVDELARDLPAILEESTDAVITTDIVDFSALYDWLTADGMYLYGNPHYMKAKLRGLLSDMRYTSLGRIKYYGRGRNMYVRDGVDAEALIAKFKDVRPTELPGKIVLEDLDAGTTDAPQ